MIKDIFQLNMFGIDMYTLLSLKWITRGEVLRWQRNFMPYVRIPEREERRPPRQCNSQKGKFIADSSQGSCRIQGSGAGSERPDPKLLQKHIG